MESSVRARRGRIAREVSHLRKDGVEVVIQLKEEGEEKNASVRPSRQSKQDRFTLSAVVQMYPTPLVS